MNKLGIFATIGSLALGIAGWATTASSAESTQPEKPATAEEPAKPEQPAATENGKITDLVIKDAKVGEGKEAEPRKLVTVHYTGWLYDPKAPNNKSTKFDSSLDRGEPFSFPLGAHQVIPGWDKGVEGMKVGGKRTLIIPSNMAYGESGAGALIPPGATLIFDVELLDVK